MKRRKQEQEAKPPAKEISPRALAGIVLIVMLAALAVAGWWAWGIVSHVEEFGQASDSFGYLEMARDVRAGKSPDGGEKYTASSENARAAIEALKKSGLPVETWEAAVAPAAYHYDARSGKVINQYPPGVGWMLSLWPEGKALAGMYGVVFCMVAGAAIWVSVWAWKRVGVEQNLSPLLPAVLVFLALHAALGVLGATVSYSVDFFILAAIPAAGFAFGASRAKGWLAILFAALSGATAGYAVVMRVAAVLLLPGLALCIWGAPRNKTSHAHPMPAVGPLLAWSLGVILCGILPLMLHQQALTGSMLGATYSHVDVTSMDLSVISTNAAHYFAGDGSLLNWVLFTAAAVFALGCAAIWSSGEKRDKAWMIGAIVVFALPTFYFLTHRVTTPYYQFPAMEMTVLVLASAAGMGSVVPAPSPALDAANKKRPVRAPAPLKPPWDKVMMGAILLGAAVSVTVAMMPPKDIFGSDGEKRTYTLADEVKNPKAWVFAARYSGTLWWSHNVYAMDVMKGDEAAQAVIFKCVKESGSPAYVVDDRPAAEKKKSPEPAAVLKLKALGGAAEKLPKESDFEGAELWRVKWQA